MCPRCGSTHGLDERFCPRCGMPLVYAGVATAPEPVSERRARARKVKPQYSEGNLVRVAGGRNQAEAEFIQGLLLEEGVPSILRRTRGFDVPDFLAAGPRDVLVAESGASVARDVLLQAELAPVPDGDPSPAISPGRLLAGLLAGIAVVGLIAIVGTALLN